MRDRALSYEEVRRAARRAAREIEREWPEWKKNLSVPTRVPMRPLDTNARSSKPRSGR